MYGAGALTAGGAVAPVLSEKRLVVDDVIATPQARTIRSGAGAADVNARQPAVRQAVSYRDLDRHGQRAGDGPAEAAGRCGAAGSDAAGGPEHAARAAKDAA